MERTVPMAAEEKVAVVWMQQVQRSLAAGWEAEERPVTTEMGNPFTPFASLLSLRRQGSEAAFRVYSEHAVTGADRSSQRGVAATHSCF